MVDGSDLSQDEDTSFADRMALLSFAAACCAGLSWATGREWVSEPVAADVLAATAIVGALGGLIWSRVTPAPAPSRTRLPMSVVSSAAGAGLVMWVVTPDWMTPIVGLAMLLVTVAAMASDAARRWWP